MMMVTFFVIFALQCLHASELSTTFYCNEPAGYCMQCSGEADCSARSELGRLHKSKDECELDCPPEPHKDCYICSAGCYPGTGLTCFDTANARIFPTKNECETNCIGVTHLELSDSRRKSKGGRMRNSEEEEEEEEDDDEEENTATRSMDSVVMTLCSLTSALIIIR